MLIGQATCDFQQRERFDSVEQPGLGGLVYEALAVEVDTGNVV